MNASDLTVRFVGPADAFVSVLGFGVVLFLATFPLFIPMPFCDAEATCCGGGPKGGPVCCQHVSNRCA